MGGFQRKVQQAFKPMEEHTFVMEKQHMIHQLDQKIRSHERELRAHSASGDTAKQCGAQRRMSDITVQKEYAVKELEKYKQRVEKLRQDVVDKLASSRGWNQSNLASLMREFAEQ